MSAFRSLATIRAIPVRATVLSPIEGANPVLHPHDHVWQAGEDMDDSQDDDAVTDSESESVKIVEHGVIGLDQATGDQDQPHAQLGYRVVDEAFEGMGNSERRIRPPVGLIGTSFG
jgi:hypothetical protein